ncbi:MAG: hypothetical protein J2P55_01325 [Rhizobiales bacterium]|nr:hypothetical protein [Hyphomicrobiales bacterium]
MTYLECHGGLSAAEVDALRERWREYVASTHAIILEKPMGCTVRNWRDALERPPPPAPWSASARQGTTMGYRPLPYRNTLPDVPWIIRGNNAALSLGAILLGALAALWWGAGWF